MILPVLQSVLTLILVVAAFGFMTWRLLYFRTLVNTGTRPTEDLTDTPGERVGKVVTHVLGHKKVFEDVWAGLLHVTFLYGFLILAIGHVEVVLEGLTAFRRGMGADPFSYRWFLPDGAYSVYRFSQDLLAAIVLLTATIALLRRWSGRITRLIPRSQDAENILWFIVGLYVTFFLLMGSSLALAQRASGDVSPLREAPFSSLVAGALSGLGTGTLETLQHIGWWGHVIVFLGFGAYIPLSKHMHLVFATPNIYFFRRQRFGLAQPLDFEEAEKFGVDRVQELPWKTLLDTFACTECGRCNAVCPAHATGKPLMPMKVLHDIKVNLRFENGPDILKLRDRHGRPVAEKKEEEEAFEPKTPLISKAEIDRDTDVRFDGGYTTVDGQIHTDEIWACTTCAACAQACPVLIDSVPGSLIALRQGLVMMESEFPQEATSAFKGMEVQGNPWGVGADARTEWAEGLDVPKVAELDREVEYLFWVGCAGATDPRARKTQQALVKILKAAGVDFAVLGKEEKCTGDPARRMGNEYLFVELATGNIETLGKYRFQKILVTCPHCLNSLGNDYRELGGEYEVVHHSRLLAELLAAGKVPLDLAAGADELVTFHDPCYLGRYAKEYQPPRDVLSRAGVKTVEMAQSREKGFCCGAGGGRVFLEETIGSRVNVARTEQALATGAKTVAVGCPFCMTMISDGTKAKNVDETVQVRDIAEIVAGRLKVSPE